jgi:hypothetical protein
MAKIWNPLAETLTQAHTRLLEDLHDLQEASNAPIELPKLRHCLEKARGHLTELFRLEEQGGYLRSVEEREPFAERAIDNLRGEHRQLAQALDELIGQTATAAAPEPLLRDQVRQWIKEVRRHESRENALVQDAFNLDISAED